MPVEGFTRTIHFITTFLKITDLNLAPSLLQSHRAAFSNFTAPTPSMDALFTYQFPFVDRRAGLPYTHMHRRTLETEEKEAKLVQFCFCPGCAYAWKGSE